MIRILNKFRRDTDEHAPSSKQIQYMIDSSIVTTPAPNADIKTTRNHIDSSPEIVTESYSFPETTWTQHDDGKWHPPDSQSPTISKTTFTPSQNDSGANRIVTDDINKLTNVKIITPIPMGGCNKHDEAAITCTAVGDMTLYTSQGTPMKFKAYYSAHVDGTIISPTAMVRQHFTEYHAWIKYANCESNSGTLKLLGRNDNDPVSFNIFSQNDLWYHQEDTIATINTIEKPTLNHLSNAAKYELWHQRLAHPGQNTMEKIHQHVIGVPKLKGNAFYRCPSCLSGKLCTKRSIGKPTPTKGATTNTTNSSSKKDHPTLPQSPQMVPGQHFSMDFGFVRGSSFKLKDKTGKTITSIDGMNSYLSIIDRATRYMWVFPCKSKTPPLDIVERILNKFKCKNPHCTVRTDQGGELGKSDNFANLIAECDFCLELTGVDASAQNGLVENPNKTFGQMMRCLLYSSELGPEYWSFALQYAAYIRNRLPPYSQHNSL